MTLHLLSVTEVEDVLRGARRVGVLGIRSDAHPHKPAHHIPSYLAAVGYEIVPIPTKDDASSILGFPVCRSLRDAGELDILSIFLRPDQVPPHAADILFVRPRVVWFQSGLIHIPSAEAFAAAGLRVAHECIACRRASMPPAWSPLAGQVARE